MNLKTPPHSRDMERNILAMCMTNPRALDHACATLDPEDFYIGKHQSIFRTVLKMVQQNLDVNTVELEEQMRIDNVSDVDAVYLAEMFENCTYGAYKSACKVILEHSGRRKWINAAQTIIEEAYRDDAQLKEVSEKANKLCTAVCTGKKEISWVLMGKVFGEVFEWSSRAQDSKGVSGLPTGFSGLDVATTGAHPGDLWIVAARPGMGKSALAMKMLIEAGKRGDPCAMFNFEMPNLQSAMRALCMESSVSLSRVRGGLMSKNEMLSMGRGAEGIHEIPVYLDDTPGCNVYELAAKSRILMREVGLKMIVVDYLQLLSPTGNESRWIEMGIASRQLKMLARELGIPIIALSQLSRECEKRPDKRPVMSDLAESGNIERDADTILFVYRDFRYNKEANPNMAEIIIGKQRNGPCTTVPVGFEGDYTRFADLEPETDDHWTDQGDDEF